MNATPTLDGIMEAIIKILTPDNILFMLKGAVISLIIAAIALCIGILLGIVGAAGKISKNRILRSLSSIYVNLFRGTPMLLQILFFFLGVPVIYRAITGSVLRPNTYVVAIIAISLNSGAYSTELIRSGIMSIDKGQWEASKTLGLTYTQMMRHIILPQAFKQIVPPMVSEFITLIKDSSLASVIGAVELLQSAQIIGARYYNYLTPLIFAGIIYLFITTIVSIIALYIERRLSVSD